MMIVAETVIPLTDTYHSIMIITKTDFMEMPTKKVTLEKGHILLSAMEKIIGIGITTNKTTGEFTVIHLLSVLLYNPCPT